MTRPLDHYCAVCRYALDRETEYADGRILTQRFVHSLAVVEYIEPHDPQPVPLVEMFDPNMVCDFCKSSAARWGYRLTPVAVVTKLEDGSTQHEDYGDWWAACLTCGLEVDTGNLERLVRRALRQFEPGARRGAREALVELYQPLLSRGVLQRVALVAGPSDVDGGR